MIKVLLSKDYVLQLLYFFIFVTLLSEVMLGKDFAICAHWNAKYPIKISSWREIPIMYAYLHYVIV